MGQKISVVFQNSGRMDRMSKEVDIFEANILNVGHTKTVDSGDKNFQWGMLTFCGSSTENLAILKLQLVQIINRSKSIGKI